MKPIPWNQIKHDAANTGVSPYILVKRFIKYREATDTEICNNQECGTCQHSGVPEYNNEIRTQCEVIGINSHFSADITINNICNYFAE